MRKEDVGKHGKGRHEWFPLVRSVCGLMEDRGLGVTVTFVF